MEDKKQFKFVRKIKKRSFDPQMQVRLLLFVVVSFIAFIFLAFYTFKINHENNDEYAKRVYDNLRYTNNTILSKRGEIVDRNGTVLAYSEKVYNLILDPKEYFKSTTKKDENIDILVEFFGFSRAELIGLFAEYGEDTTAAYVKVRNQLSEDEVQPYLAACKERGNINVSWLEEEYKRVYPYGSLGAEVIGYATESTGVIGIESYYNSYLTGTNGREYGYVGEDANLETTIKPATNGDRIWLGMDINIQRIVENKLIEFNNEFGSLNTACIIANPNNGDILAMAQYPSFDLNNPRDLSQYYTDEEIASMDDAAKVEAYYDIWQNFCVSNIYEPGSVFKTFTIASGLEEGKLDGTETYMCDGAEEVQGVSISCAHTEGHGELTLSGALEESCNDALMQIVSTIGKDIFSDSVRRLGFGAKTGIDLPGEEYGLLYNKDAMTAIDLATNCFGQNLNITMVQQVGAFSSIINGGYYYQPHIVDRIDTPKGETIVENKGTLVRQTFSKETSDTMREYLKNVVDYGTGAYVQVKGYSIGGKTGAAEKQPRDKTHYLISFCGFMPVEDPQVVFYVIIDEPEVEDFASSRAAQVLAHDIIVELIPYLEIYPEDVADEININKKDDEVPTDADGNPIEVPTDEDGNPIEVPTNEDGSPVENTEQPTESPAETPTEAVTEPPTESVTEQATESAT